MEQRQAPQGKSIGRGRGMHPKGETHQAVLLAEAVAGLVTRREGIYVDATFGCGGHSSAILAQLASQGVLIGIDKDQAAIERARQLADARLIMRQGSFTKLATWIKELGYYQKVEGVLLDLGVSSPQLDSSERGFSFLHDGPLDMRMDQGQKLSAAKWINYAKEEEIASVLWRYGEERFSRRIARAIVGARKVAPIVTTGQLAAVIKQGNPKWERHKHPATRSFQAIRIFINDELRELDSCLEQSLAVLRQGGRLVVISFHSLEDRMVKQFMQRNIRGNVPEGLPVRAVELTKRLRQIGVVQATVAEVKSNPRARSAIMRIMEKTQ